MQNKSKTKIVLHMFEYLIAPSPLVSWRSNTSQKAAYHFLVCLSDMCFRAKWKTEFDAPRSSRKYFSDSVIIRQCVKVSEFWQKSCQCQTLHILADVRHEKLYQVVYFCRTISLFVHVFRLGSQQALLRSMFLYN